MRSVVLSSKSVAGTIYGRKALALSYELDGLNVRQNVIRHFAQMHYAREEHDEAIRLFQWVYHHTVYLHHEYALQYGC